MTKKLCQHICFGSFKAAVLLGIFLLWTTPEALMQEFDRDVNIFKEQAILELQTDQKLEYIKCEELETIIAQANCLTLKHKKSILDDRVKIIEDNMDIASFLAVCLFLISIFLLLCLVLSLPKKESTNEKMEHK